MARRHRADEAGYDGATTPVLTRPAQRYPRVVGQQHPVGTAVASRVGNRDGEPELAQHAVLVRGPDRARWDAAWVVLARAHG